MIYLLTGLIGFLIGCLITLFITNMEVKKWREMNEDSLEGWRESMKLNKYFSKKYK